MKKIEGDTDFVIGTPKNHKDLELLIFRFFKLINPTTKHNQKLSNQTGVTHETDVYFQEYPTVDGKYLFDVMIECKMWNKNLNQKEVSSFKNFCNEFGTARGIVLCTKDFQKGCKPIVLDSPVLLLTIDEFLDTFFQQWFHKCCLNISTKLISYNELIQRIKNKDLYPHCDLETTFRLKRHYGLLKDSFEEISIMNHYSNVINIDKLKFHFFYNEEFKNELVNFDIKYKACNSVLEFFELCEQQITKADTFIKEKIII